MGARGRCLRKRSPQDRIVDRGRAKHHPRGWDGVSDVMERVSETYRRHFWAEQDAVVMIGLGALQAVEREERASLVAGNWQRAVAAAGGST